MLRHWSFYCRIFPVLFTNCEKYLFSISPFWRPSIAFCKPHVTITWLFSSIWTRVMTWIGQRMMLRTTNCKHRQAHTHCRTKSARSLKSSLFVQLCRVVAAAIWSFPFVQFHWNLQWPSFYQPATITWFLVKWFLMAMNLPAESWPFSVPWHHCQLLVNRGGIIVSWL